MKLDDIDTIVNQFTSRRNLFEMESEAIVDQVNPCLVEYDTRLPARDVVSIDGSHAVLFKDPEFPLWIVATRTAIIRRRYDHETPRYEILGNDCIDNVQLIDGIESVVETDSIVEIMDSRNADERNIDAHIQHISTRSEEMVAMNIARENSGIMIFYDGAIAGSKEIVPVVAECNRNGNVIVGISKESAWRKINGITLDEKILHAYTARNPGFTGYHMINEGTGSGSGIGTCFARFHHKALKWFRVDFMSSEIMPLREILRNIACYSQVNTQPGNPFPPLCAHDVAVKIRQYKPVIEEYMMQAMRRENLPLNYIASGLTNVNGKLLSGSFHDFLDGFTKVTGTR